MSGSFDTGIPNITVVLRENTDAYKVSLGVPNLNVSIQSPDNYNILMQQSDLVIHRTGSLPSLAISAYSASYANTSSIALTALTLAVSGTIEYTNLSASNDVYVGHNLFVGNSATISSITGSITNASLANAALFVLQNTFTGSFTGSFFGDGSNLTFNTINTSQNTDSLLIIGNIYNNYSNKQTTVFRNGDVVVSGSVTVSDTGVLLLTPRDTPNTHVSGALFYSSSGELYLGS